METKTNIRASFKQALKLRKQRGKGFSENEDGVAAVEFALVAPFLLAIWMGFAEIAITQQAATDVSRTASVVSDIISQSPSLNAQQIDNAMLAGEAIISYERARNNIKIRTIGVEITDSGPRVKWARGHNTTDLPAVGSVYALDNSLTWKTEKVGGFIIVANTELLYESKVGGRFMKPRLLQNEFYFRPRVGNASECTDC